jgi:hypothetical protein
MLRLSLVGIHVGIATSVVCSESDNLSLSLSL